MPFVSNMNTDEEQNPNVPQGSISPSGGGGGVRLAPSSAIAPTAGGTGGSSPSTGGQFASLNQYLTANQGQAEPLANKITGGINQQYNTLQGQNTSTLNDINSQVAANAVPSNANAIISQEAANPVSFTSNPGNIASFKNLLNASYSGPASAESTPGYTAQQNAINNAIASGQQATQTEAGRENLLSQNETTPTTGVTALNSAILSQSPTALNKVETAYQPFSNLLTGLQTGAQSANQNIAKTQGDISQSNAAANKQIADQINALNTNLTNTANQDIAAQNKANQNLQTIQTQLAPANTALNNLTSEFKQYFPTWNPNITNPFTPVLNQTASNVQYTPAGVETADQAAQAQAFQSLISGLNNGLPAPISTVAGTQVAPYAITPANTKDLTQQVWNELYPASSPLGVGAPLKTYQDTQNWMNNVDPAWSNLLQQLNLLNPAIWSPK